MTVRYKLRTLLILLAILPPLGAVFVPPLIQWFAAKPVPKIPTRTPPPKPVPQFAMYNTGKADPSTIYQVLTTMLAGNPDVRMSLDASSRSIAVLAPPDVHAILRQFMVGLQTDLPSDLPKVPETLSFPEPPPAREPHRL